MWFIILDDTPINNEIKFNSLEEANNAYIIMKCNGYYDLTLKHVAI